MNARTDAVPPAPLLTVRDVAARLVVSGDAVERLVRSGKLRATNVGTGSKRPRWRVSEADLEAFRVGSANVPAPAGSIPRRKADRWRHLDDRAKEYGLA